MNERFAVGCGHCRESLKFGNFTSFGGRHQRILLKCVLHVRHDYFSSFIQSDHCPIQSDHFVLLPLPLVNMVMRMCMVMAT